MRCLRGPLAGVVLGIVVMGCTGAIAPGGADPTASPDPVPTPTASPVPDAATPSPTVEPSPSPAWTAPDTVLHMDWGVDTRASTDSTVLLADGAVVWADPKDGLQQGRISAEGIAWVKRELSAAGVTWGDADYEASLKPGADPPGGGASSFSFVTWPDGTPVRVTARIPSGTDIEKDWNVTSRLQAIVDLGRAAVDADSWIPVAEWTAPATPYLPERYELRLTMWPDSPPDRHAKVDVDSIDWPITLPLEPGGAVGDVRCVVVDAATAQAIAGAATGAPVDPAERLSSREQFYLWAAGNGWLVMGLHTLLPDDPGCVPENGDGG